MTTEERIIQECDALKALLISKNRKYGDTATRPGYPYNLSPVVAIKGRINDKLGRLAQNNSDEDEDLVQDLLGYFILLKIALANEVAR